MTRKKAQTLTFPGFGERLLERAKGLGYENLAHFAREKKIDKGSVYAWASGKRLPGRENLLELERLLEVPWQWLLVGDACAEELIAYREGRWKPPATADPGVRRVAHQRR